MDDLYLIQHILALYEHASTQQINRDKTTIFFQHNGNRGKEE